MGKGKKDSKAGGKKRTLHIRDEVKPNERRVAVTPEDAGKLVKAGFTVVVEKSQLRCFPLEDYERAGCSTAEAGSWTSAPRETIIVGLKELPESDEPLVHTHVFFCHAFKNQAGWSDMLKRFGRGGGSLYDLEYLTFANGRRVAAFGRAAGMVGAALGVAAWCAEEAKETLGEIQPWNSQLSMVADIKHRIGARTPTAIVIGALGRSGRGATDVLEAVGVKCTKWDMAETAKGGPFLEVLAHDIFINCILMTSPIPPFVTAEMMGLPENKLSVVVDVSCDTSSSFNPVPFMDSNTSISEPTRRVFDNTVGISIDHLPSLLPREASEGFSADLIAHLLEIGESDVWKRAEKLFKKKLKAANNQ